MLVRWLANFLDLCVSLLAVQFVLRDERRMLVESSRGQSCKVGWVTCRE